MIFECSLTTKHRWSSVRWRVRIERWIIGVLFDWPANDGQLALCGLQWIRGKTFDSDSLEFHEAGIRVILFRRSYRLWRRRAKPAARPMGELALVPALPAITVAELPLRERIEEAMAVPPGWTLPPVRDIGPTQVCDRCRGIVAVGDIYIGKETGRALCPGCHELGVGQGWAKPSPPVPA